MLEPNPKQEAVIQDLLSGKHKGGALIGARVGAGKTLVVVEYIKRLLLTRLTLVVLLIAPLNTRLGWKRTFEGQGVDLPFRNLNTEEASNFDLLLAGEPGVYFVGPEFIVAAKRATKTRPAWDWRKINKYLDIAVYDEVHGIKSRNIPRTKTVRQIKPKSICLGLSGTPFGNTFDGAWSVTKWLWPNEVLNSFWLWATEWTRKEEVWFGGKKVTKIVGEKDPGEYVRSLPAYYYWGPDLDTELLPPKVLYVELTKTQQRMYTQMEDDLIAWMDDNPLIARLPVEKYARLRQITLGVPTITGYVTKHTKKGVPYEAAIVTFKDKCASPKIDALKEFLTDHEGSALILTDSKIFARVVANRIGADLWDGDVSATEREAIKERFRSGETQYLVATPQSMGTGTDGLQDNCHTIVWLSKTTSGIVNEQTEGRLHRMGQSKDVAVVEIRAIGTEDDPGSSRLQRRMIERARTLGVDNVVVDDIDWE